METSADEKSYTLRILEEESHDTIFPHSGAERGAIAFGFEEGGAEDAKNEGSSV